MKKNLLIFSCSVFFLLGLSSCRGDKSSSPPVHLIQNMVEQTSYDAQSRNDFFKDKKSFRPPVSGTVAQGEANTNIELYKGIKFGSTLEKPIFLDKFPITLTDATIKRGQERYNIYCAPCHGYSANNNGLVTQAAGGSIRPTNLHDQQSIQIPVGEIYKAITLGVNNWNMPGFEEQMSVQDRWAVTAYVRALQISQRASASDISKNKIK